MWSARIRRALLRVSAVLASRQTCAASLPSQHLHRITVIVSELLVLGPSRNSKFTIEPLIRHL